ncbi:hypothetical protein [Streptomyces sp. NRRL S-920]|uniref:hypothetical protein n=1 Tax=Streptomyces sp. NRRL S-920 TaxID=1463921 RepID=UPI0004C531DF|nr:hypothetical protein [Streptomyces sp. NRRL S-920]
MRFSITVRPAIHDLFSWDWQVRPLEDGQPSIHGVASDRDEAKRAAEKQADRIVQRDREVETYTYTAGEGGTS